MAKTPKSAHFEKDLEKLESLVDSLEEGGLSLDDSLKKFEEGIQLARACEKALSAAEKRVEILLKNADGDLVAQRFDEAYPGEVESHESSPAGRVSNKKDYDDDEEEEDDEGEGGLLF